MTLVSSIIVDAFRECNMLALGKAPTALQQAEALRLYNNVVLATYGNDAGERMDDWPLGDFGRAQGTPAIPLTVEQLSRPALDRRLLALNAAAMTVYLPAWPQDGARYGVADPYGRLASVPVTLDGNGRPVEETATLVLNVNGTNRQWIYRADLARWCRVTDLTPESENPFPAEFDTMFIILLAMRLNPRYGRSLDEQSALALRENRKNFVARYLQSRKLLRDDSIAWPYMSTQAYDTAGAYSNANDFGRGFEEYRGNDRGF